MRTRIIRVPFLIPAWAAAQVLLPGIVFLRRGVTPTADLIAHELAHIDQIHRLGLIRYWVTYLWLLVRHGYEKHPMEIEAHTTSKLPEQLTRAQSILEEYDD